MFGKAIRSELYRISRMKSTYILPAVLLVIVLVTNFLYMAVDLYGLMGLSQEQVENIQGMGTSAEGYEESFMTGFRAGLESSQNIQEEQELHILGEGSITRAFRPSLISTLAPFTSSFFSLSLSDCILEPYTAPDLIRI